MDDKRPHAEGGEQIEREAEKRRREIDGSGDERRSETTSQFNPVEGVPPHRAGINEDKAKS